MKFATERVKIKIERVTERRINNKRECEIERDIGSK